MPDRLFDRRDVRASERSTARARELRQNMSPPEIVLWAHLRGRRLNGLRFRRQHPLGEFIADFYCCEAALVVEIDGRCHQGERRGRDRARDEWMRNRGLDVLHILPSDIALNFEGMLVSIERLARQRIATLNTPSVTSSS